MEEGETPEQAARRELEEETGYVGGTWTRLMTISGNPSTTDNLTYCFIAQGVTYSSKASRPHRGHRGGANDARRGLLASPERRDEAGTHGGPAVALLRHDAEP